MTNMEFYASFRLANVVTIWRDFLSDREFGDWLYEEHGK